MKNGDNVIVYADRNGYLHPLRRNNGDIWAFPDHELLDAERLAAWVSKYTQLDYRVAFVIPDDDAEVEWQSDGYDLGTIKDGLVSYTIAFA